MAASFATLSTNPAMAQPAPAPVAKPANAYSSGVVYDWFFLALQLIQRTPGLQPAGGSRRSATWVSLCMNLWCRACPATRVWPGNSIELELAAMGAA